MKETILFFFLITSSVLFCASTSANAQNNLKSVINNSFTNHEKFDTHYLVDESLLNKITAQVLKLVSYVDYKPDLTKIITRLHFESRFDEKNILLKLNQTGVDSIAQNDLNDQTLIIYFLIGGSILLIIVLGLIIYRSNLKYTDTNKLLNQKNQSVILLQNKLQEAKNQVEAQQLEIKEAKSKIESQQLEINETNSKLENTVKDRADELMAAYQELLVAHEELDSFMYRSSHDLKGPIARLIGLCYVSKLDIGRNTNLEYFEKLEDTAREMDAMLQRLISVGDIKISEPDYTQVNLEEAVKNAIFDITLTAPDILVEANTTQEYYETDSFFLEKILENLLQNAMEYIDHGKDEHYIKVNIENTDKKGLKISVSDNGIGIPTHLRDRVFHMFYKGTEISEGAGLGLYEVKLIVKKLNGKAYINSENKTETEVIIDLPAV